MNKNQKQVNNYYENNSINPKSKTIFVVNTDNQMKGRLLPYEKDRISRILEKVSEKLELPIEEIKSKCRQDELIVARFSVYWIANLHYKIGPNAIGRYFEREHGAIHNGLNRAYELIESNPSYGEQLDEMVEELRAEVKTKRISRQGKIHFE